MVYLGEINSRMKDFYDVWDLASRYGFDGSTLAQAIRVTFERRSTALPREPLALSEAFVSGHQKQRQWQAFTRRQIRKHNVPGFEKVMDLIREFLTPVIEALFVGQQFERQWPPGGPWQG